MRTQEKANPHMKRFVSTIMLLAVIFTASFTSVSVFAADRGTETSTTDITYTEVNTVSALEAAVQVSDSVITVSAGTYDLSGLENGLKIADNVSITGSVDESGNSLVTFSFDSSLMNSQAGLYITGDNVILTNIIFTNGSETKKPVVKVQSAGVQFVNCTIVNASKSSALVFHASTGAIISGCAISNTNTASTSNSYAVIQINAGSEVTISDGTSISCAVTDQPHIEFSYSSSNSDYLIAGTLTFDSTVKFLDGYDDHAVIYSAAPNGTHYTSVNRHDVIYYIDGSSTTTFSEQTSDTSDGLQMGSSKWYCYNAEYWYSSILALFDLNPYGYIYTDTDDGADLVKGIVW